MSSTNRLTHCLIYYQQVAINWYSLCANSWKHQSIVHQWQWTIDRYTVVEFLDRLERLLSMSSFTQINWLTLIDPPIYLETLNGQPIEQQSNGTYGNWVVLTNRLCDLLHLTQCSLFVGSSWKSIGINLSISPINLSPFYSQPRFNNRLILMAPIDCPIDFSHFYGWF